MDLEGAGQIHGQAEAARFQTSGDLNMVRLRADTVQITLEWERGANVGGEQLGTKVVTDGGHETISIDEADLRFERTSREAFFLAYSETRSMDLTFTSATGFTLTPEHDVHLAKIGQSPQASEVGNPSVLGFWHTLEGPVAKGGGSGAVNLKGDFSLFVHNVVVHAQGPDEEWSEWTGYKESDTKAPAKGFELRVTNIHVENGTFVAASKEHMELYAPSLEADFDGVVTSPGVTGQVLGRGESFDFQEDPLRLDGRGQVQVDTEQDDQLRYRFSGEYEVHGTEGVETAAPPRSILWYALGGLMLATLTSAGLAKTGVIPAPTAASRERRYTRYMQRGLEAIDANEPQVAARYYERATRVKRESALAWYNWAHAELEAGNGQKAEEVAIRAAKAPGIDQMDILDLRASAALERKDWPAFEEHLTRLAKKAPGMARRLVWELEVDTSKLTGQVRDLIGQEDHLDGYA